MIFIPQIYQIIRSRRKSIGLIINQQAQLIIRAPHYVTESHIRQIVTLKQDWIVRKQQQISNRQSSLIKRQYRPGEKFLYLGYQYELKESPDLPKSVVFDGDLMISSQVLANAKEHLENWYKTMANELILPRVEELAKQYGLVYKSAKINDAKGRWGSCGYRQTLNFSWRLIMTPQRVIDYVIVHELMHLKQMNHSTKFWAEVAKIIPNYNKDEAWLKQYSASLVW